MCLVLLHIDTPTLFLSNLKNFENLRNQVHEMTPYNDRERVNYEDLNVNSHDS